jgi:hypothetical protein
MARWLFGADRQSDFIASLIEILIGGLSRSTKYSIKAAIKVSIKVPIVRKGYSPIRVVRFGATDKTIWPLGVLASR